MMSLAQSSEVKADTTIYSMVSQMPEYIGGQQVMNEFIARNVKYPKKAMKEGISGKVYVNFIITPTGEIGRVWIARGVRPDLDNEAMRVIKKMPKWKAGRRKDIPVNVRFTLPINFVLK